MKEIEIIDATFEKKLSLPLATELRAGFPSPAEDYMRESIDLNRDLIRHPESTFYGRIVGDSMIDAGIREGDIAVIDKAATPNNGDIVVAFINNEFTIKYLDLKHSQEGYIELRPANSKYQPIRIDDPNSFQVWGVVKFVIHQF